MASIDAFLPLYISDYLADTTDLSTEEHGAYLLLLMNAWKRGGTLPLDHDRLARMVGLPRPRWDRAWATLSRFFAVDGDTVTQGRVSREIEKAKEVAQRRTHAGRTAAARRWHTESHSGEMPIACESHTNRIADASESHSESQCAGDAIEMPSHISHLTETDQIPLKPPRGRSKNRVPRDYPTAFEALWSAYPRKDGKPAALEAWTAAVSRLGSPDEVTRRVSAALVWQVQSQGWRSDGGKFIPHFASYLNRDRFDDARPGQAALPIAVRSNVHDIDEDDPELMRREIAAWGVRQ